jgi:hypothetical protein
LHLGGGGSEAGEESFADLGHLFDDAAGPGYREFTDDVVLAAKFGAD